MVLAFGLGRLPKASGQYFPPDAMLRSDLAAVVGAPGARVVLLGMLEKDRTIRVVDHTSPQTR